MLNLKPVLYGNEGVHPHNVIYYAGVKSEGSRMARTAREHEFSGTKLVMYD